MVKTAALGIGYAKNLWHIYECARGVMSLQRDYSMVTIMVRIVFAGLVTVTTALPAAKATNPGLVS
jgi:hypothetical protein